ncbi:unnamed protein product [Sphenostylis stenocarpa]|uniref:TRASH domain-containing protein n=1 Tax=Sphenostylis stenocarpa TaxID=92480 RepID=A0AA86W601_9FABA|nr:unnamed protein product [Sphenostylis stenocarpa]
MKATSTFSGAMRLEKCCFCSSTLSPGRGIQMVRNGTKVFRFCRFKCFKNFKRKNDPWTVKWIKVPKGEHAKDIMTQIKKNKPGRYDRNFAENVLKAIPKIGKRVSREERHHKNRMKGKKLELHMETAKELEQSIILFEGLSVLPKDPSVTLSKMEVAVSQQQSKNNYTMEE